MNFRWTEKADELIRKHSSAGCSARETADIISHAMGQTLSPDAVIGRRYRLGLSKKNTVKRTDLARCKKGSRNAGAVVAGIKNAIRKNRRNASYGGLAVKIVARHGDIPPPPPDGEIRDVPFVETKARPVVALLDLEPHHCRWPIGNPCSADFGYCGETIRDESVPYCTHHCRIAYVPVNKRSVAKLRMRDPAINARSPSHLRPDCDGRCRKDRLRGDLELPKALPNGARTIMASRAEPDDSLDYFPTPPFATRALCEVILPRYCTTRSSTAWEPACGEGHMAEVLSEYFREVVATDIHDYGYGDVGDFLNANTHCCPDWIVTNPPFNDKAEAFVFRAIEAARVGVSMFLRLQWLETIGRYERIFKPHPPALIAQFAERVPLCKGRWDPDGSTATAYLWIVWTRSHTGPTEFAWIPPGQRESLTRPDDRERFTANPVRKRDGGTIGPVWANPSIGEPVGLRPLVRSGEGEPASDPGFSAGSPMDDSELDIPDRLKRDANNPAPFHQAMRNPHE